MEALEGVLLDKTVLSFSDFEAMNLVGKGVSGSQSLFSMEQGGA